MNTPGTLQIYWQKNRRAYLNLAWGSKTRRYVGPVYASPTPLLDTILANMHRLEVDELARLIQIDKRWRPIT